MSDSYGFGMAPPQALSGLLGPSAGSQGGLLAPPPQAALAAYQPPHVPGVNPLLGVLDNLLLGGAVQRAQQAGYASRAANAQQNYQYQAINQYLSTLSPHDRAVAQGNPDLFKSLHEYHNNAPGSTFTDQSGQLQVAPQFDPASGKWTTPNGSTPSIGGDFADTGGVISSKRTGEIAHTVTPPQNFAASNTYVPLQVDGAQPGAAGGPAPDLAASAPRIGDKSLPRGIRNNDPVNVSLLPNGKQWAGQTGSDGDYPVFATAQAGWAAADKNLAAYGALHGINTVAGAIARWSPHAPPGYAASVSQALGVKPSDPINLADPATRQTMLAAMARFENGRPVARSGPAPSITATAPKLGQAAPGPASNLPPGSIPGKVAQPLSPDEIRQAGLAPGRYQREPNGNITTISAAPKDDMARIASLTATAEGLRNMAIEQGDFLGHNRNFSTGAPAADLHVMGHTIGNPFTDYQESANTDAKAMAASAKKQIFMVKPANAGQRILATEIPLWQQQTQSLGQRGEVNQGIYDTTVKNRDRATAQAKFFSDWIYKNGNLDGADAAWDRQRGPSSSPVPAGSPVNAPRKSQIIRYDANGQRMR